ncbi:MAG: tRNA (adenosine(37)-N6)-threonylcarbamoyltransferase complex ATPase subunit type 1 TsaE [Candidatus Kuenenbacteria bacterium]
MEFIAKNFLETQKLAKKIIKKLKPGDVLALKGNLGSGKTCFAQGLAKALGIKKIITSPTFALLKIYPVKYNKANAEQFNKINHIKHKALFVKQKLFNRINPVKYKKTDSKQFDKIKKLYHFDLYRINNEKELLDLGFEEILEKKDGIIVIEWPERAKKILKKNKININFKFVDENTRTIKIKI